MAPTDFSYKMETMKTAVGFLSQRSFLRDLKRASSDAQYSFRDLKEGRQSSIPGVEVGFYLLLFFSV